MSKRIAILNILFFLGALFLPLIVTAASFYQPSRPVELVTEVTVGEMTESSALSRISVIPVDDAGEPYKLKVLDAESRDQFGQLVFFRSGAVKWMTDSKTCNGYSDDSLLILPGSTLPVDVLPVRNLLESPDPLLYEFRRTVRGQTFEDRISLTVASVSSSMARREQWIREGDPNPAAPLFLIEAKDVETGDLIVRQLWSHATAWWLFEQTPFRRSWRVR